MVVTSGPPRQHLPQRPPHRPHDRPHSRQSPIRCLRTGPRAPARRHTLTLRRATQGAQTSDFGTQFSREDRLTLLPTDQGMACKSERLVKTAMANPLAKSEPAIRKVIEDLMIERMGENDMIVTRYMANQEFQGSAFPILSRTIFETVRARVSANSEHA